VAGARLIRGVDDLRPARPYVLYHHERWDGDGYPARRAGERIPLEGRILCIADAFDAMTSHRAYRRALPVDQALEEVERCAGSQFDPWLAEAFVRGWELGEIDVAATAGAAPR
jgi:HD-GYP domain-containing protein (c-di-GMP phosphodiesterase class II)